jgi:hypothetical protein
MHIHGNQMNLNTVNPYSAAAAKAEASLRAANVRKNLRSSAEALDLADDPDAVSFLHHWMGSPQAPMQEGAEYDSEATGNDSDFG